MLKSPEMLIMPSLTARHSLLQPELWTGLPGPAGPRLSVQPRGPNVLEVVGCRENHLD